MKTALLSGTIIATSVLFGLSVYAADLVNINIATQAELETLNGIGPAKAQAIIEYREGVNGPFETVEEIKEVSGIGDATFANIKDFITVGETAQTQENTDNTAATSSTETPSSSPSSSSSTSASNKTSSATVRIVASAIMVAGAQQEFEGELSKNDDETKYANFSWNFGDGRVGRGQKINHTYMHPGKYVVVLSVDTGEAEPEARLTVEVTPLELALVAEGGALGVRNNSKRVVDIGGWFLSGGGVSFSIPQGTVVLAGETLRFSPELTGVGANLQSQLLYPSGELAVAASAPLPAAQEKTAQGTTKTFSGTVVEKTQAVSILAEPEVLGTSTATIPAETHFTVDEADGKELPLWSYGLGLAALITLGVASALFVQRTRPKAETSSIAEADEFEIIEN